MTYSLRPYQKEAVKAIMHEWRDGNRKTLLVLPTGTGKTIVFANVVKLCVEHGLNVLVLAHRGELLEQAGNKIHEVTGIEPLLEKAESTAIGKNAKVVIASMNTLARDERLHAYQSDYFGAIVLDEAHHALSRSYQKIFAWFSNSFVLGVTATAERGDKKELGQFFDSLAYEYTLKQAVEEEYLVPMKAITIPLKLDISSVGFSQGDYQASSLGKALLPYLELIAEEMAHACKNRKTVVFVPLVKIAEQFRDILNAHGFRAAEVDGMSKNRNEILQDFASGKYNVAVNSMLLTEGWDCPPVDCVVVLRPTQVRGLYQQMIGRGTRPYPGKKDLLILDFLWLTGTHDLCHPSVLVAKSREMDEKMTDVLNQSGETFDLLELADDTEKKMISDRREALAKKLAEQRFKQRRILNPLEVGIMLNDSEILDYEPSFRYELQEPTEKQKEALARFGMENSSVKTKGEAQLLIGKLISRREKHLSTLKQIRFLDSRGFQDVSRWTFEEASQMMDQIAKNHWQVPEGTHPEAYLPERLKGRKKKRKKKSKTS